MKSLKKMIRKSAIELRESITLDEVSEKSSRVIEKIAALKVFEKSRLIMCYMDFKNEIMTVEFIKTCLSIGKRVAIPMIIHGNEGCKTIIASEIFEVENDVKPGAFGILEPKKDKIREIKPEEIDLIIVPGVAFDIRRNRLGYGAGFYDSFLKKVRLDCYKIGIAFEFQVLDEIPVEAHDIELDMIITENRII